MPQDTIETHLAELRIMLRHTEEQLVKIETRLDAAFKRIDESRLEAATNNGRIAGVMWLVSLLSAAVGGAIAVLLK